MMATTYSLNVCSFIRMFCLVRHLFRFLSFSVSGRALGAACGSLRDGLMNLRLCLYCIIAKHFAYQKFDPKFAPPILYGVPSQIHPLKDCLSMSLQNIVHSTSILIVSQPPRFLGMRWGIVL